MNSTIIQQASFCASGFTKLLATQSGAKGASGESDDLQALRAWLVQYSANPSTLACYRREAERLLFWALLDRQKPISSLTAEDMAA